MRRRFALLLALAGTLAASALAASAEDHKSEVAAPGNCAEPRRFDGSGACADCADPARNAGFSVAGPARARFSPADVAAGAGEAGAPAPEIGEFSGRGPCDTPGSCTGAVAVPSGSQGSPGGENGGVTVIERPPRPTRPPGNR